MPENQGLPSNLYSGAAVVFDNRPYMNFYLQTQARKLATKEAVSKHLEDFSKNLTPSGMDGKDVPVFMEKKEAWQKFVSTHPNARNPSSDNGRDYQEAMRLYNDTQAYAVESISKVKKMGVAGGYGNKPDHPLNEAAVKHIENVGRALNDPLREDLNLSMLEFEPKPYGFAEQQKDIKSALGNVQLGSTVSEIKKDGQKNIITTSFKYDKKAIDGIRTIGANMVASDPKILNHIQKDIDNQAGYQQLDPTFFEAYGEHIKSPEDYQAAILLISAKQEYDKQTVVPVSNPPQPRAAGRAKAQTQGERNEDAGANFLANFLNESISSAKQNVAEKKRGTYVYNENKKRSELRLPMSSEVLSQFTITNAQGQKFSPDEITLLENGNYGVTVYERDKKDPRKYLKDKKGKLEIKATMDITQRDLLGNVGKRFISSTYIPASIEKAAGQIQSAPPPEQKAAASKKGTSKAISFPEWKAQNPNGTFSEYKKHING